MLESQVVKVVQDICGSTL